MGNVKTQQERTAAAMIRQRGFDFPFRRTRSLPRTAAAPPTAREPRCAKLHRSICGGSTDALAYDHWLDRRRADASGDHHFPAFFALKVGATLRILDADSVAVHRIHGDGNDGFFHQQSDMGAGQEYDMTVSDSLSPSNIVYCHDHGTDAGTMTISVHD
jgi:hypothetical protein